MASRRNFIGNAAVALAGAWGLVHHKTQAAISKKLSAEKDQFQLGIAGYSFVHFNLAESLSMMKRMDVRNLCIKDFHLPFTSTAQQISDFHQTLSASNVIGYAVGPIYMNKSREQIDQAFDYARKVGVDLLIGIPQKDDLAYIAQKANHYKIRYAIHNHGPEDKLYPNASVIADLIGGLNAYMGICFDMGHEMRDGKDPKEALKRYHLRIFDIHLKNVTAAAAEGTTCELSRGVIDIPEFVDTLREIGYKGMCSLEYEKDMKDPLAGLAESTGYFRGVVAR